MVILFESTLQISDKHLLTKHFIYTQRMIIEMFETVLLNETFHKKRFENIRNTRRFYFGVYQNSLTTSLKCVQMTTNMVYMHVYIYI